MSYNSLNIGGQCPPGISCPNPMAIPVYTQAPPRMPIPVYQPKIEPQQQFGIVGGPALYTPPPAISYGTAYTCYNPGHQSYNQTIGTLSSIIIGAIYSAPMNGGSAPSQLAIQGGANPYAAYCPPGQNPQEQYDCNQQYAQNCGCNPPGYRPQPYPAPDYGNVADKPRSGFGSSGSRDYGNYQPCNPCAPRAPKAYDAIWGNTGNQGGQGSQNGQSGGKAPKAASTQWQAKATGETGVIKINDRYTIKLDEKDSSWELYDKGEKTTMKISGDPKIDVDGDGKNDVSFKRNATFILEDGTKISVKTTAGKEVGTRLSSELYITNNDKSIVVTGLANDSKLESDGGDGKLKVSVSETNGKAIDKLMDDGAFTAYQVGDSWVDGATGTFLSQSSVDNAESSYQGGANNPVEGKDGKDDKLKGTKDGDTYIATTGIDKFDGGEGTDTAVFSGNISDYKITRAPGNSDVITVTDADNNVTRLTSVERLVFNDETYFSSVGTSFNEVLFDGDTRQVMFGKEGDDIFTLNEDNPEVDYFSGGKGSDTLVLDGKVADYSFDTNAKGVTTITDSDGNTVAIATDVENFKFMGDNKTLTLDQALNGAEDPVISLTGNDGDSSKSASDLFAEAKTSVASIVFDAKGGSDTVDLGPENASKYTILYDSDSDTFKISNSDKPGVTLELKNVEYVKIGDNSYRLSETSDTDTLNNLLTMVERPVGSVKQNTNIADLFDKFTDEQEKQTINVESGLTITAVKSGTQNYEVSVNSENNLVVTDKETGKQITLDGNNFTFEAKSGSTSTTINNGADGAWTTANANTFNDVFNS